MGKLDRSMISAFLTIFCLIGFGVGELMKLEGTTLLLGLGSVFSGIMLCVSLFKED